MIKLLFALALILSGQILPVERQIASLPYEVGVGFDARGRERWRVTQYSPDQVTSFYAQDRQIIGGVFTHNHPGEDHCVNLSVADVNYGAWLRLREIRAVGQENGLVYVAVIRRPHYVTVEAWNRAFDRNRWRDWCSAIWSAWHELGFDFEVIKG